MVGHKRPTIGPFGSYRDILVFGRRYIRSHSPPQPPDQVTNTQRVAEDAHGIARLVSIQQLGLDFQLGFTMFVNRRYLLSSARFNNISSSPIGMWVHAVLGASLSTFNCSATHNHLAIDDILFIICYVFFVQLGAAISSSTGIWV